MIYKNFMYITTASMTLDKKAQIANIMFYIFLILALVALAFAVFSFFKFKIPNVIGDITNRNARKSIAKMRLENEKSGNKSFRPHPVASERGTLTEPIKQNSSKLKKQSSQKKRSAAISDNTGSSPTDVLDNSNATQQLNYDENATEVLAEGTEVLSNEQISSALNQNTVGFKMIQDIVLIHTEEII